MEPDSFFRKDLQELSNEIKFLSPRYQKLVTALIALYVQQMRAELEDPEIRIDVLKSDGVPMPTLDQIFDTAFVPGRRITGTGKPGDKKGKVGARYEVNLDLYQE